jgi:hypothetical protein
VKILPVPSNMKRLKAFLGLAGYCTSFVPNFSPIVKPLHTTHMQTYALHMGKWPTSDFWNTEKQFMGKEFIVTCDASADGIASVCIQGIVGKALPIPYISRVLTEAEETTQRLRGNSQP